MSVEVIGDLTGLPHAVDMSAYRILQESLTNALRHAPGAPLSVEVRVDRASVRLAVVNGAPARTPTSSRPSGRGVPGMKERATLLGGTLEAGPDGQGYAVRARLPLAAPRAAARAPETGAPAMAPAERTA